jgi:hypothetical protein
MIDVTGWLDVHPNHHLIHRRLVSARNAASCDVPA